MLQRSAVEPRPLLSIDRNVYRLTFSPDTLRQNLSLFRIQRSSVFRMLSSIEAVGDHFRSLRTRLLIDLQPTPKSDI
jgi:hypothetical protein